VSCCGDCSGISATRRRCRRPGGSWSCGHRLIQPATRQWTPNSRQAHSNGLAPRRCATVAASVPAPLLRDSLPPSPHHRTLSQRASPPVAEFTTWALAYSAGSQNHHGHAQPWYAARRSSALGCQPTCQQQADFSEPSVKGSSRTFSKAGVPINDSPPPIRPGPPKTLSWSRVRPATRYRRVIGMTQIGGSGSALSTRKRSRPSRSTNWNGSPRTTSRRADCWPLESARTPTRRQSTLTPEREFRQDGKPHRFVQRRGARPCSVKLHPARQPLWARRSGGQAGSRAGDRVVWAAARPAPFGPSQTVTDDRRRCPTGEGSCVGSPVGRMFSGVTELPSWVPMKSRRYVLDRNPS